MRPLVSIVIPAWNEASVIADTLRALRQDNERPLWDELIVVDDGSTDSTHDAAAAYADLVLRHDRNRGKGASLDTGWRNAKGDIVVFLDADLRHSAVHAELLLQPLLQGDADMTVAVFPKPSRKGGFGLVKRLAEQGIYRLSGFRATAPLSGQRAVRRELLEQIGTLAGGFGIEVGLTIDAARAGFRICEVPVSFYHRETGRDLRGFYHRGKQFVSVGRTLYYKWRNQM